MHHDNLSWAGALKLWSKDSENRKDSVAGDDRSPAWRWIGSLYLTDRVVIPADNLMTVLREGGKLTPTGNGKQTFKSRTQSGLVVNESDWELLVNGRPVLSKDIEPLKNEKSFPAHEEAVRKLGFSLFVKRAKIGLAKHVRVRPRFDNWSCGGTILAIDDLITVDVLQSILTQAGRYSGLCDWRPSSPKSPGPFGKFTAKVSVA